MRGGLQRSCSAAGEGRHPVMHIPALHRAGETAATWIASLHSAVQGNRRLTVVLSVATIAGLALLADHPYESVAVVHGAVDLTRWNCRDPVSLDGSWQILEQALAGKELSATGSLTKGMMGSRDGEAALAWAEAPVPGLWHDRPSEAGKPLTAATYRLVVDLPAGCDRVMLEVPDPRLAVRIWADGQPISAVGEPALTATQEHARSLPALAAIRIKENKVILALEVSDHQDRSGGIAKHIILGGDLIMRQLREWQLVNAAVVSGALLSMLVFAVAFGRADRSGASHWLACLLCIFILREVCIAGLLAKMAPALNSDTILRLKSLCLFLVWPVYARALWREVRRRQPTIGSVSVDVLGAIGAIGTLVLPTRLISRAEALGDVYALLGAGWALWIVGFVGAGVGAVLGSGSVAYIAGLIVLIGLMLHDFIIYLGYTPAFETAPFGMLLLMFVHVSAKGAQFSNALSHSEALAAELADANRGLDLRVQERTHALRTAVEELQHAKAKADTAVIVRTRFLSHLSHEVRNPLNIILGTLSLTRSRSDDPALRHELDGLRSIGANLLTLLDDTLDLARLESGSIRLRCETIDPGSLFKDLAAIYARQSELKGLDFGLSMVCAPAIRLLGDGPRLYQVLSNLLHNAVKFTARGRVDFQITVDATLESHVNLQAHVLDTGPGISVHDIPRIFQEFERSEFWDGLSGTGLGLAIARQTARAMGGDIVVSSVEGEGSTFTLDVPFLRGGQDHGDGVVDANDATEARFADRCSVLIVEDSREGRSLLSGYVLRWGLAATCSASVAEALIILDDSVFDAILLDINLGKTSGLDVLSGLRAHTSPVVAMTPVIVISANVFPENVEAYLGAGADVVIAKPIDFAELHESLRLLFGSSGPPPTYQDRIAREAIARAAPAFAITCRDAILELDGAQSIGDNYELLRIIHRLRGGAVTFGYKELEAALSTAETVIRSGVVDGYAVDRLGTILRAVTRSAEQPV